MIIWVRLYFKPSGLRCEMTVMPLEWVLGRDNSSLITGSRYALLYLVPRKFEEKCKRKKYIEKK